MHKFGEFIITFIDIVVLFAVVIALPFTAIVITIMMFFLSVDNEIDNC